MKLWLNGEIRAQNQAKVDATGAGTLSGRGVFTTFGIANGRPLWPQRHFARVRHDAALCALALPFDEEIFTVSLAQVIAANAIENGMGRVTLTARGDGRWNEDGGVDCSIVARSSKPAQEALRVWLSPYFLDARRPLCGVKSTSYEAYQRVWSEAQARDYDEALLRESAGALSEAARHNLFWIRDGRLHTPSLDCGALPGIGRALILEWARAQNMTIEEGHFGENELRDAEEIFLTNAVSGPRAVVEVGGAEFQSAPILCSPGPLTAYFQRLWRAATTQIPTSQNAIEGEFRG